MIIIVKLLYMLQLFRKNCCFRPFCCFKSQNGPVDFVGLQKGPACRLNFAKWFDRVGKFDDQILIVRSSQFVAQPTPPLDPNSATRLASHCYFLKKILMFYVLENRTREDFPSSSPSLARR